MFECILQVLGSSTVRVRPSKTAIHTNGLQREQDSNSGSKTPSPSRTGDTNSPGGSHNQMRATSRQADRHAEVVQQPAQLRNHGQSHASTSGSPPLASQPLAGLPLSQPGSQGAQQPIQMGPSPAQVQQHLMANGMAPGMMQQQQQPANGASYGGAAALMPVMHGQPQAQAPQQSGYHAMPSRPAGAGPRVANQNYAPTRSPISGRTSPSLKRGYDDVQYSNANAAAAAAAAFLSQQQADDKRMRMSH